MADQETKNLRLLAVISGVVAIMVALSFAAVPLYDVFCRVTGFGGTTQRADSAPEQILDREVTVYFKADINRNLPWKFTPNERSRIVKLGQDSLTSYNAVHVGVYPSTGVAVYNVSPPKAGKYFHKLDCFCFAEQTLQPGEDVSMPVSFYVDPALDSDPDMDDVKVITLSYTFFAKETKALDSAMEGFYNQEE